MVRLEMIRHIGGTFKGKNEGVMMTTNCRGKGNVVANIVTNVIINGQTGGA